MALIQTITATVTLLVLLFVTPYLSRSSNNKPFYFGIITHIVSTILLLIIPSEPNYPLIIGSTILTAIASGIITPRVDALASNILSNEDRTLGNAIMSGILLLISTPFGYISGILSEINLKLPFLLMLIIFILCLILMMVAGRIIKKDPALAEHY